MIQRGQKIQQRVKVLLYILIFLLIYEGIIRKLLPSALGTVIFFLKDVICFYSIVLIIQLRLNRPREKSLLFTWRILLFALIPVLINTLFKDTLLVFFGLKQYIMYVIVGLMVPVAFPALKYNEFRNFLCLVASMIMPTTIIAVIQNSLPATHWLNLSVGGESLEGFAAAGYLRVSSTFSFTGQYSWFLNVESVLLAFYWMQYHKGKNRFKNNLTMLWLISLSIALIIGVFITGGRTAVLGCGANMLIGFVLSGIKFPKKIFTRGLVLIVGLVFALVILRSVKPEFFAAYDQRSEGTETKSHSEELQERILGAYTGQAGILSSTQVLPVLLGNGLGVMSNGADQISRYAYEVRRDVGLWTETDFATTVWEGGLYLVIVWYGFRIWVISLVFNIWRRISTAKTSIPLSFFLAYVTISGLYETLSLQPPLAIWWWFIFGAAVTMENKYKYDLKVARLKKQEYTLANSI